MASASAAESAAIVGAEVPEITRTASASDRHEFFFCTVVMNVCAFSDPDLECWSHSYRVGEKLIAYRDPDNQQLPEFTMLVASSDFIILGYVWCPPAGNPRFG